jgi:hypothetical protein
MEVKSLNMNKPKNIEVGILSGSKIEMHSRNDAIHSSLEGQDHLDGIQTNEIQSALGKSATGIRKTPELKMSTRGNKIDAAQGSLDISQLTS